LKEFIEKTLHQKIELERYDKIEKLPLMLRANYDLYDMILGSKGIAIVLEN
jgi:hypothetical protein